MTGIIYVAQEDVDFQAFNPSSYSPTAIAVDGVRARTGSSANVCASYSILDRQPLSSNIGQANSTFNGSATFNTLSFACRYYVDGSIDAPTGNEYFIKFDNFSFTDFNTHSVLIKTNGTVCLWDNTTSPVVIGSLTISLASSSLQRLDVMIDYGTSGSINIWLGGALAFTYTGDITAGSGVGSGFFAIEYGSGGGTGSNTPTYWSEIIVADTTDIRNFYVGYTSTGNTAYEAPYCDYSTVIVTTSVYGYTFNYPITVTTPPYYVSGHIVQAGFASVGASIAGQLNDDDIILSYFSITNGGGADFQFSYDIYFQGNPNGGLSKCLPRDLNTITAFNMQTQSNTGATSGPSDGTYGIAKFLTHFVFGAGTPNPCTPTAAATNVMILT